MREDWEEVELGEILIQSRDKHKPVKTEPLFYIGLEHIEKSTGRLTNETGLSEIKTVKNKFSEGQLLYGKLRPYLNKVYLSNKSGVCSTDILVFEVSPVLLGEFALLLMLSRKFVNDMSANTNGVNLPRVSTKYINNYPFPLPPLPEQRAIVAKIEELFSGLDKGIADLNLAKDQLKVYRQAVLKKAFEGELTKIWRSQNNTGWIKNLLGNILKVSSGKGLTAKEMSGMGYPVYGGNGINGYHSEYNFNEEKLIIGRVGVKCGVTHITKQKSWVTDNALVVQFNKPEEYNLVFMKLKLQFENLNKLSSSTAQPVVSGVKIYAYEIEIPPIEEQNQIVKEIESRLSVCDKVEQSITESLEKAKALRQSILKKAFEGTLLTAAEIAKCKAAPDYEPASVLLERIKKEKKK